MPDIQSLHLALGAMSQKERDEFLSAALSQQPLAFLESILPKLELEALAVNTKVRMVFKMGLSPVAHAFKGGPDRQLNWVVPVVPDHLRPLVYSTSRLINEFQETLVCLQNGRGDFVKAFTLLNPENMLGMVNRFSDEMQAYTQQLRDANGRFNRFGPRGKRPLTAKPAPSDSEPKVGQVGQGNSKTAPKETEPELKPRKTNARTRTKAQSQTTGEEAEGYPVQESPALEAITEGEAAEAAVAADHGLQSAALGDTGGTIASHSFSETLAAFGFDVTAVAGDHTVADLSDDSEK